MADRFLRPPAGMTGTSLRTRMLGMIAVVAICAIVVLIGLSRFIVLESFRDLEKPRPKSHVAHMLRELNAELDGLDVLVKDWAAWDATYTFVQDHNSDYSESHLIAPTFTTLKLDFMLFLDTSGQLVHAQGFDHTAGELAPLAPDVVDAVLSSAALTSVVDVDDSAAGYMMLPDGFSLVAARPILTDTHTGPVQGTLIFGRHLEQNNLIPGMGCEIKNVTILSVDDPQLPGDMQQALDPLSAGSEIFTQHLNDKVSAGYALLDNPDGEPTLLLRVKISREIYQKGQETITTLIVATLLVALLLAGVSILLLERLALSRISKLNANVQRIASEADLAARVPVKGRDELSSLGESINQMLAALQRSQEATGEGESRLRRVISSISENIYVAHITEDGSIRSYWTATGQIFNLTGYPAETFRANPAFWQTLIHPDDQATASRQFHQLLDGQDAVLEYRMIRPDGEITWIRDSAHVEHDPVTGEVILYGLIGDITARKQVEEALRRSEQQYRATLDAMADAIHVVDTDLRLTLCNAMVQQWNQEFGIDTDVTGQNVFDVYPFLLDTVRDEYRQVFETGKMLITEEKTPLGDREIITETRKIPILEQGRITQIITVMQDITARRQTEEALATERNLLRTLIDHLPDAIYVKDTEGRVLLSNAANAASMGIDDPDMIIGKTDFDHYPPELAVQYSADDKQVIQSGQPVVNREEPRYLSPSPEPQWILTTKVPLRNQQGEVTGLVGIGHNITQRKQTEEALRESQAINQSILAAIPDLMFRINRDGVYLDIHPGDETKLISPLNTLIGATLENRLPADVASLIRHHVEQAFETGEMQVFEYQLEVPAGLLDFEGRLVLSRPDEVLLIARDITERRQAELEREQLLQAMSTHATELATVTEVSLKATTILDVEELLWTACNLTKDNFDLYHAHIYLLDEKGNRLVLAAGVGKIGRQMVTSGHNILLEHPRSLVARAARTRQCVVVNDVRQAADFLPNPLLPETQSELAIPMVVGDELIGVLDVQSRIHGRFTDDDINVQTTLAAQIAIAIKNARLFTENTRRLAIIENSNDLIALSNIDDLSGRAAYINPAGLKLLGCTQDEFAKLSIREFHPPESWELLAETGVPHALEHGIWRGEITLRRLDGTVIPVDHTIIVIRDEQGQPQDLAVIISDITERKKAEQALHESEERYRTLVENIPIAIYRNTPGPAGDFLMANPAYSNMFGYDPEEVMTRHVSDTYTNPTDRQTFSDNLLAQGSVQDVELELKRADGSVMWGSVTARVVYGPDGNVAYFDCALLDITQRKQTEEALRKANRAYRTISDCNQAMVRATSEDNLLEEVCQTIVATGGYRMAWVGLIEHDENRTVRPAAHAGHEEGYLSQIKVSWGDNEFGQGVIGQAIRTGKLHTTKDFQDDDPTIPGRVEAVERGYRSSIALPLIAEGQTLGALSVYADQPDAFDPAEINLLTELAYDLAFGIMGLRTRTEREHARQAEREQRILAEALRNTAAAVNSTLNFDEVLERILANLEQVMPHDTANIMLLEEGYIHVAGCRGYAERGLENWIKSVHLSVTKVPELNRMTQTHQPTVVPDTREYPNWALTPQSNWVRSFASTPVLQDDQVIGFLNLYSETPGFFAAEHVERLRAFADQAAIAIRNARLYTAEREQRALAEALRDTAAVMNSTLDPDEVLDRILANIKQVVPNDAANIMLIEEGIARVVRGYGYAEHGLEDWIDKLRFTADEVPVWQTMLATGEPFAIPDTKSDPDWLDLPEEAWIESTVKAPIKLEGRTIGILHTDSATPGFYNQEHARHLQAFADQAAIAIRNARLFTAERDQRTLAEALRDTATALSSTLVLEDVMQRVLENVGRVVPHDAANIMTIDPQNRVARVVGQINYDQQGLTEWVSSVQFPIDDPNYYIYDVLHSGKAVVIENTRADPRYDTVSEAGWIASFASAPIRLHGEIVGLLNLDSATPGFFNQQHLEGLQAFADQTAVALRNAELFTAEHDQRSLAEALRDTAAIVNSTLDPTEVLDNILENVGRIAPHDSASIMMIDDDGVARVVRCHPLPEEDESQAWVVHARFPVEEIANLHYMQSTGQPLAIQDTQDYPGWMLFPESEWIRSQAGAPIRQRGQVVGFVTLDSREPGFFTHVQAERLEAFADQVATAIHNAQLFDAVQDYAAELEQRVHERTAELETQRVQLQAILDSMGEGVVYSVGERVVYVNHAFTRLLGYEPDEMANPSIDLYSAILSSQNTLQDTIASVLKAFKRGDSWQSEARLRRKDGTEFDAALISTLVHIPGAPRPDEITTVTVFRDISQEKALRAQKDRFIANASHELRTPLANIKTRLYLIRKQPDKLDQHLEVMGRVTDSMADLIENLLDVSRFERGVIPLYRQRIVLQDLINDVLMIQQPEAERKHITLGSDLPETPLEVFADAPRITQVITNLITNAINYTSEGGQILVELSQEPPTPDHPGGQAVIHVRDNGLGIEQDMLPLIFEPFFRANEDVALGTGLGLTIAREIVNLHEGDIEVSSLIGAGSVFTVRLNLFNEEQADASQSPD